jgi:toxin ParE1/3/4
VIPVRYDPAAELELLSQIQYLESRRVGLGRRFFSEVKESEALIAQFPESSLEIGPGVRKKVLPNFQYSLFYCLDTHGVTILAVAHHRRKPGYWMPRVPGEER